MSRLADYAIRVDFESSVATARIGKVGFSGELDNACSLNADTVVAEYGFRCDEITNRNPDMTPAQVHAFVLAQWYQDATSEPRKRGVA